MRRMMRLVFNVLLFVLVLVPASKAWADPIFYPGSGRITVHGTVDIPGRFFQPDQRTFTAHAIYHTRIYESGYRALVLDTAGIDVPHGGCSFIFLVPFISINPQSFIFSGECNYGSIYTLGVSGNFNGTGILIVHECCNRDSDSHGTVTSVEYTAPEPPSFVLLMVGLASTIAFGRRVGYRRLASSK